MNHKLSIIRIIEITSLFTFGCGDAGGKYVEKSEPQVVCMVPTGSLNRTDSFRWFGRLVMGGDGIDMSLECFGRKRV